MRALHLEKENMDLRTELLDARHELSQLRVSSNLKMRSTLIFLRKHNLTNRFTLIHLQRMFV